MKDKIIQNKKVVITMSLTLVAMPLMLMIGLIGKSELTGSLTYGGFFLVGAAIFLSDDYKSGFSGISKVFLIVIMTFVVGIFGQVQSGTSHDQMQSNIKTGGIVAGVPTGIFIIFLAICFFKRNSDNSFFKITKADGIKFIAIFLFMSVILGIIALCLFNDKNIAAITKMKFIPFAIITPIYLSIPFLERFLYKKSKNINN